MSVSVRGIREESISIGGITEECLGWAKGRVNPVLKMFAGTYQWKLRDKVAV